MCHKHGDSKRQNVDFKKKSISELLSSVCSTVTVKSGINYNCPNLS